MKKSSWKTTLFGISAAIGTALTQTQPEDSWLKIVGGILAIAGTGGLGLAARDNDKSSEDIGAK